jgi:predicted metalloprotease with PDZ domain
MRRSGVVALAIATILGAAGSITIAVEIPPAESTGTPAPAGPDASNNSNGNSANAAATAVGGVPRLQESSYPGNVSLKVDVTDIERHVFNVHESIPVQPGPLTLLYPQWLPGNHAPRGPIDGVGGLLISANGRRVEWTRDPVNIYAFQVQVPAGAKSLELEFQYAAPLTPAEGRLNVTPEIVGLQWNAVVFYPAGYYASRITFAPELTLPEGWEFGSALDIESRRGSTVWFKHVSLDMLVDSPVLIRA